MVLVVENTLMIVSSSHGTPLASSCRPPQRSTASSPSTVTATDAPTSPSTAKFSAKASFTAPKPSSQRPLMSTMGCSLRVGGLDGAEVEAGVARLGHLVALLAVRPDTAGIGHEHARLAWDVGPEVPGVGEHEHGLVRHLVDVGDPFLLGVLVGLHHVETVLAHVLDGAGDPLDVLLDRHRHVAEH